MMQSIDDETNEEMWPTLNEAHQGIIENPVIDGWEKIVSPETLESKVLPPKLRKLRHCRSSPDLRFFGKALEAVDEGDDDDVDDDDCSFVSYDESSAFVSYDESSAMSSAVMVDLPSTSSTTYKRIPSFRDAILSRTETSTEQKEPGIESFASRPKKIKPKIVVTPIKRCAKSTGDLQSLVIHEEKEVLGESDAMEYYHRKAHGASGRVNTLKLRPDEAKRKQFTLQKKQMQREQQTTTN